MTELNVTVAVFGENDHFTETTPLVQYDYGQILRFDGLELPDAYEVHFTNTLLSGTTVTQIGTAEDGVTIPDSFLLSGNDVYAFIFLHEGDSDGETEYSITIPVLHRPQPSDEQPTPVQQSAIDQAIASLNAGVTKAEGSAEDSEAWAVGQRNGVDVEEGDPTYHNNAKYYAENGHGGGSVDAVWGEIRGNLNNQTDLNSALNQKVDKVTGKGLSTNDFTTEEKNKLAGLSNYDDTAITRRVSSVEDEVDSLATVARTGAYNDLSGKPTIPTKTSDLQNDSGFLTSETDPVFTASPAYGISSTDITAWNGKQNALSAGTNITINGSTISATDTNTTYTISISGNVITLTPSTGSAQTITIPAGDVQTVDGFNPDGNGEVTTERILTQAQYDALSSAEKNNGMTYYISDAPSPTAPVTSVNGMTGAVVIGNATTSSAGLMSATDKSHLDDVYADYSSALIALGVS